jgi:hypothetical protein
MHCIQWSIIEGTRLLQLKRSTRCEVHAAEISAQGTPADARGRVVFKPGSESTIRHPCRSSCLKVDLCRSAGQPAGGSATHPTGGPAGPVHWLVFGQGHHLGRCLGLPILALQTAQLLAATEHHLAQFLEADFQFAQHLFGVAIRSFLN